MSYPTARAEEADERDSAAPCPECGRPITYGDPRVACPSCGRIHHDGCWRRRGGCATISCSLAEVPALPKLSISFEDLNAAVPMPSRSAAAGFFPVPPPAAKAPRRSGMAVAAFICGLAGVPLFGLITGAAAVVLACIALGDIRTKRQKGVWFAGFGLVLGIADVVGWVFLLAHFLFHGGPASVDIRDFKADLSALKKLPPETRRALSANVLISVSAGGMGEGIGSGVVLGVADGEALILTNRHVVDSAFVGDGADRIGKEDSTVKFVDEAVAKGRIVWIAPSKVDLALIKAPCRSKEVQAAQWAKDRAVQVGDSVFAVGNPHGFAWTLTQGAVSQMRLKDDGGQRIHVIQTSAAINPGNSGGGLYDRQGFLTGVTTWTNDKRFSEGISFAIGFDSFLELVPESLLPKPGRNL